jgi:soluble lytic murein transglycosylase-like protein
MQRVSVAAALGLAWVARLGAAGLLAASLGGVAAAQVLDISPDGAVTEVRGPAVYSDPGAAPQLITQTPRRLAPSGDGRRAGLAEQVQSAADHNEVSAKVVEAVAWRESRFNAQAISPKGAVGVMQLMPGTARALGVDPHDSAANLEGGAAYLARMLRSYDGDLTLALAAYNAGPDAVRRYAGVPPYAETKAFVDAILNRLANSVAEESVR